MKRNVIFFGATLFMVLSHAQPINPWLADGINRGIREGQAAYAEQLEQQESRISSLQQKKIQSLRQTPFYGAIAIDKNNPRRVIWGGGEPNESKARNDMLKICGAPTCVILKSFSNNCAMVASPIALKDVRQSIVAIDANPERAIDKAYDQCEEIYGKGKCRYAKRPEKSEHTAFCTGYDYGIYSTK